MEDSHNLRDSPAIYDGCHSKH